MQTDFDQTVRSDDAVSEHRLLRAQRPASCLAAPCLRQSFRTVIVFLFFPHFKQLLFRIVRTEAQPPPKNKKEPNPALHDIRSPKEKRLIRLRFSNKKRAVSGSRIGRWRGVHPRRTPGLSHSFADAFPAGAKRPSPHMPGIFHGSKNRTRANSAPSGMSVFRAVGCRRTLFGVMPPSVQKYRKRRVRDACERQVHHPPHRRTYLYARLS